MIARHLMGGIALLMEHEPKYYTRQAIALSMKLGSHHIEILRVAQESRNMARKRPYATRKPKDYKTKAM